MSVHFPDQDESPVKASIGPEDTGAPLTPPAASNSRFKIFSLLAALALAAVLLYYSLRGIDWREAGKLIAGANLGLLVLVAIIMTFAIFLRAVRWRVLLTAEGPVGVPAAFWATSAGYFGNNFLPARAGELVRTFMISSRCGLNSAYVLTTALSERVADAIALVVISALVLLTLPEQPGWLAGAAKPFAFLGLAGAAVIAVLPRLESLIRKMLRRAPVSAKLQRRIVGLVEHGLRGLRVFHDARRLFPFLGLTIVIWTLDATWTVIGGAALGLSIPLPVAFLLIAGLGLGSALPATPGYVGIYQFVAVKVLVPFGFSKTDAIAYILLAQAMQYAVIGVWGAFGFLHYRGLKNRPATRSETISE